MKEYLKPEVEEIKFSAEEIANYGDGQDNAESNNLSNEGWGG